MMSDGLVLQMPEHAGQLILLFHGVGSTPANLAPVGLRLGKAFPNAVVASIPGRHRSDLGGGYQWFSVVGITEENRPARIAEAMPEFVATIREWQARCGVSAARTALVGFSQGAIMALESTQLAEPPSGHVVAMSGRFANDPEVAPAHTAIHFIHGRNDGVILHGYSIRAAECLARLGVDATVDVIPGLGHQINDEVETLAAQRLRDSSGFLS